MTTMHRPLSATLETLKLRARLLARARAFFTAHNVLEVETPILSHAGTTDPNLASLITRYTGPGASDGKTLYLQTSPEFAMKRLLAAGAGSIYQICKTFRDGEAGRLHNPEFTMIEWYRLGFDHHRLMDEVAELASYLLEGKFSSPPEKLSYRDAFLRYCGIDPHAANVDGFIECAQRHNVSIPRTMPRNDLDPWRDLLLTHVVEPQLGRNGMTFIFDYPASQAALARIRGHNPPVGERFELYIDGIEIANGFHELGDADEQRGRFERDLERRREQGLPMIPIDERLIAALKDGLPECSGVAMGFDRLVMIAAGVHRIGEAMAFPYEDA